MNVIAQIFNEPQDVRDRRMVDELERHFPSQVKKIQQAENDEEANRLLPGLYRRIAESDLPEDRKDSLQQWLSGCCEAWLQTERAGWRFW